MRKMIMLTALLVSIASPAYAGRWAGAPYDEYIPDLSLSVHSGWSHVYASTVSAQLLDENISQGVMNTVEVSWN